MKLPKHWFPVAFLCAAAATSSWSAELALDAPHSVQLAPGATQRLGLATPEARQIRIAVRELAFDPASASGVAMRIRKADGSSVGADWTHCNAARVTRGCGVEIAAEAGARYNVEIEAPFNASARVVVSAAGLIAWPVAGTAIDKLPRVTFPREPQRYTVEVKEETFLTVGLLSIVHEPATERSGVYLALQGPDGARLDGTPCRPPACKIFAGKVKPGTYVAVVQPQSQATVSARLFRASDALERLGDGPMPIRITEPGRPLRLQFDASGPVAVAISDVRLDGSGPVSLRMLRPDGVQVGWSMLQPGQSEFAFGPFAAQGAGVHTLVIDPGASTMAATVVRK